MEICKHKYCGGCKFNLNAYQESLNYKNKLINELFKTKQNILACVNPFNYRNKAQVSFGKDYYGNVLMGNYVISSHVIVPIEKCSIINKQANDIFNYFYQLVIKYKISIFDEKKYKGFLRHLLIRNNQDDEFMLVIVSGNSNFKSQDIIIRKLLLKFPCIKTILLNINNQKTSMILGDKTLCLYGNGYIFDYLQDFKFKVSCSSFFQINHKQTEILYAKAIEFGDFKKDETVIDAYCGTGTIGIMFSKYVKKVYGVELNKQAIKDAIFNAKLNNVDNIEFVASDAGKYMKYLLSKKIKIDAVLMDPPRSGASVEFLKALTILRPNKVVYISCNPHTLKRDLNYLKKHGYQLSKLQAVDMFCFTEHMECIALFNRAN